MVIEHRFCSFSLDFVDSYFTSLILTNEMQFLLYQNTRKYSKDIFFWTYQRAVSANSKGVFVMERVPLENNRAANIDYL